MSADKSIAYPPGVCPNANGHDPPNIPKPITGYDQWVCYRQKQRPDGKTDKIPTDPDISGPLGNVSKTNPANWLPYQQAHAYATTKGHLDGAGFVLSNNDPFAVIDLDECRDPETGEIAEWAWKIIKAFNSYTEVSPSGTGVHIWVYGTVQGTTRPEVDGHRIEAYNDGAFITVTGRRVDDTPDDIVNGQDVLDEWASGTKTKHSGTNLNDAPTPPEHITADAIIGKLNSAANADKFRHLMYEAPEPGLLSEDDGALAGIVVFYTGGDVDRAETIMRRSVRERPKWDERRKGVDDQPTTWIRWEIQKAIACHDLEDFYTWPDSQDPKFPSKGIGNPIGNLQRSLKAVSFYHRERPAPRAWVVKNAIAERFPAAVYGAGGKCKTFLAQHLGMTVAAPNLDHWLGLECITSPVVYIDFEMDEEEQARRAFDVAAGMGFDRPPENFLYAECAGFTVAESFEYVYELCCDTAAKLVVVDSLGMAIEGDSESSRDVLAFYRQYINPFRSAGVSPFIVDHQSKMVKGEKYGDKDEFGSVYKRNSNRSVFQIDGEWAGNVFNGKLSHKKTNMGPQLDPLAITLQFDHECISVHRESAIVLEDSTQDRILRSLHAEGPATSSELAKRLGLEVKDVQNRMGELKGKHIEDTGDRRGRAKVWRLIPNEDPNTNARELGILGMSPSLRSNNPDEPAA